jgi:crotonobetainyl-CoA:carnitine CoA-transferase CaiB-like acyl-CoA transferase
LDRAGVPNAPMQTIAQVLDHPQTKALGMIQQSPEGDITLLGLPLSFDGERPAFRRSPPMLGAHTGEILGDAASPPKAMDRA